MGIVPNRVGRVMGETHTRHRTHRPRAHIVLISLGGLSPRPARRARAGCGPGKRPASESSASLQTWDPRNRFLAAECGRASARLACMALVS